MIKKLFKLPGIPILIALMFISPGIYIQHERNNLLSVVGDRIITCSVCVPGLNPLPVWVRDEAGNVASKYIRIRKICY